MNKYFFCIISMALLLFQTIPMYAQSYEDKYFPEITNKLEEGDCESAQRLYNVYKVMTNKTNTDIEQRIERCGNGEQHIHPNLPERQKKDRGDHTFTLNTPKYKAVYYDNGNVKFTVNGIEFEMVLVESGSFYMGAQNKDKTLSNYSSNAREIDGPVHIVTLDSFYIGQTEVTEALWYAVMEYQPSFGGRNHPVTSVTWDDCKEFIFKLNQITGLHFRLPTEAEWEFAARGGGYSHNYLYSGSNDINEVANYDYNAHLPKAIKQKKPNELNIFDMTGNVEEWCEDYYDMHYYNYSPQHNPQGPSSGKERVLRGGTSSTYACFCGVAHRGGMPPTLREGTFLSFCGLRLAMSIE